MADVSIYALKPSPLYGAIFSGIALVPVVGLTLVSHHLGRRGLWLSLPWLVLVTPVVLIAIANHYFTVGFAPTSAGVGLVPGWATAVQFGASVSTFVTIVALAFAGQRKV